MLVKSRAPISIKKDTLEFNVKSFKTKKDANVEDLLKVLAGVEVDEDGKITVNGKPVNKILVNGKPFFGNNPTITTRNLTKDIIEKIQVVDTKTKAQAFSGEDGDDENKTINLTIKKENNKGVFGGAAAGAGTDKRSEFAGMFNRFDNDQRLSVLLGGNNINSPGFSFGEIRKMFGGGNSVRFNGNGSFQIDGRAFCGGAGITTSRNAGFNFADEFGEKLDLSTDYFYSSGSSENNTTTKRENILPDSRFFTESESYYLSDNENHSANLEFDIKVDSTLLINIEPSFRYTKTKTVFEREESSKDTLNVLSNSSTTESVVETFGKNFSNDIDVTKRFGSKGAYLRLSVENEINNRNSDDFLSSETLVFGNNPSSLIRDQFTDGENKVNNFSTEINYNLPLLTKDLFLNFGYSYTRDRRTDTQSTFDKDADGNYTIFNTDLSTDFIYIDEVKKPEVSINYRNKKISARFRTSYLSRTLENNDVLRPEYNIKRDFEAIELRSRFRCKFSPKSSTYLGYNLDNNPPRLSQLQAFENVSDPLNTIIGNPNLDPTNNHRIYAGYNAFDFQKSSWFWNATLAYSLLKDNTTLTLKAYDILNQNTNARRTANQNYIQDSQSTVLQRYFMLSFSWEFNSLGKAGKTDTGRRHYRH